MGVGGQRHAPAALTPETTRYPLYRRLGGPHSRSGRVRKSRSPPGLDPRTVQAEASSYIDWATLAHILVVLVNYSVSAAQKVQRRKKWIFFSRIMM
jgi:hypothetical protein